MAETLRGPIARDDEEIIDAAPDHGLRDQQAVGIRPVRPAADDPVDACPRPRGIDGLRVVDRSALSATLSRDFDATVTVMVRRPVAPAQDAGRPRPDALTDRRDLSETLSSFP
ncbi:hypothetical protein N7U49_02305 [Streptomyces sp. AD2-2]|nr:hypothetical protein N7U49_02305 [Streptomyces sp. AD2-2]